MDIAGFDVCAVIVRGRNRGGGRMLSVQAQAAEETRGLTVAEALAKSEAKVETGGVIQKLIVVRRRFLDEQSQRK